MPTLFVRRRSTTGTFHLRLQTVINSKLSTNYNIVNGYNNLLRIQLMEAKQNEIFRRIRYLVVL